MIKFEINKFPFALTNDQLNAVVDLLTEYGWDLDYDVVEGDTDGIVLLWVHHNDGNPTRIWIHTDGDITLREEVTWDWKDEGVETPTPQRFDLTALYPQREGEDAVAWTGRVLSHAREHGTNRQCSIGWHGECSDRSGETCMCLCHDDTTRWYTVEGDVTKDGAPFVLRAEQGQLRWPAKPGDPDTMWAHWIMATSEEDARLRAIRKEEARK